MQIIVVFFTLAHTVLAQAKGLLTYLTDNVQDSLKPSVDKPVGKSNQKLNSSSPRVANLDSTVLAKSGNWAIMMGAGFRPLLPPIHTHPGNGVSAAFSVRSGTNQEARSDGAGRVEPMSRRSVLQIGSLGIATAQGDAFAVAVDSPVSQAWVKISGAPPDLFFPEEFLGTWIVFSKLTAVVVPQGRELVPDVKLVERAEQNIGFPQRYPMRFVRNSLGNVVLDRSYNIEKLAEAMWNQTDVMSDITWEANDPNPFSAIFIDGRRMFLRITARSKETPAADRIETSEVTEVVFDSGDMMVKSKFKSQRTFTKWKFRPIEEAGDGPAIVATQVVYDYLSQSDGKFLQSRGEAVTEYTYKMQMFPAKKYPNWASFPVAAVPGSLELGPALRTM